LQNHAIATGDKLEPIRAERKSKAMPSFLSKLFTGGNDREIKKIYPVVEEVNDLEDEIKGLSDDALRAKTDEFRGRLQDGDEILDDLLPEAYAVAREAVRRRLGQRAFDAQVLGAIVLHQGKIAELKTGEPSTTTWPSAMPSGMAACWPGSASGSACCSTMLRSSSRPMPSAKTRAWST